MEQQFKYNAVYYYNISAGDIILKFKPQFGSKLSSYKIKPYFNVNDLERIYIIKEIRPQFIFNCIEIKLTPQIKEIKYNSIKIESMSYRLGNLGRKFTTKQHYYKYQSILFLFEILKHWQELQCGIKRINLKKIIV